MLKLGDFLEKTEEEIKQHLAKHYGNAGYNYNTHEYDLDCVIKEKLENFDIIIAYEHEDNYDGTSWFLFKEKETGKYFELYGSHCSCNGFENQFDELEETTLEFLISKNYWPGNLYSQVIEYLKELN